MNVRDGGLAVEKRIRELRPGVIMTALSRRDYPRGAKVLSPQAPELMVKGISERWAAFLGTDAKVFAIANTPRMMTEVPDCMSRPGGDASDCVTPRARALIAPGALMSAVQPEALVHVVDLTDSTCSKAVCEPVVGNVLVWVDSNHLTATYARTLVSELDRQFTAQY